MNLSWLILIYYDIKNHLTLSNLIDITLNRIVLLSILREACEWSCWTLNFTIILLFVYFFFMIDFIAPLAFYDSRCLPFSFLTDDVISTLARLGTFLWLFPCLSVSFSRFSCESYIFRFFDDFSLILFFCVLIFWLKSKNHHWTPEETQK